MPTLIETYEIDDEQILFEAYENDDSLILNYLSLDDSASQ